MYTSAGCADWLEKVIQQNIDSEFVINSTVNYLMSLFDFIGSTKNIKEMKLKNIITLNITMSCTNFKFNIDEINCNVLNLISRKSFDKRESKITLSLLDSIKSLSILVLLSI